MKRAKHYEAAAKKNIGRLGSFHDGYDQGWNDARTGQPNTLEDPFGTQMDQKDAWIDGYGAGWNDWHEAGEFYKEQRTES